MHKHRWRDEQTNTQTQIEMTGANEMRERERNKNTPTHTETDRETKNTKRKHPTNVINILKEKQRNCWKEGTFLFICIIDSDAVTRSHTKKGVCHIQRQILMLTRQCLVSWKSLLVYFNGYFHLKRLIHLRYLLVGFPSR